MANINWQNLPSETTPINSTNLNVMSAGLLNVSNEADDTYRVNLLKSKNLVNKSIFANAYYNYQGNYNENSNPNALFDFIKVNPNTSYTLSVNSSVYYLAIYEFTSDKVWIKRNQVNNASSLTVTISSTTQYVRVQINKDNSTTMTQSVVDSLTPQFELGETATTYSPFIQNQIVVDNEKYSDTINVGQLVDNKNRVNVLKSNQLFNKDSVVVGYINADGSINSSDTNYKTSDFIPVKPNTTYYITASGTSRAKYFNSSKTPLNTSSYQDIDVGASAGSFTTPANCYYIRKSMTNARLDDLMINEGSTALPYEAFIQNQLVVDNEKYTDTLNVGSVVDSRSRVNILKGEQLYNSSNVEIGKTWQGNANNNRARLVLPISPNETYNIKVKGSGLQVAIVETAETPTSSTTSIVSYTYTSLPVNARYKAQSTTKYVVLQLDAGTTFTTAILNSLEISIYYGTGSIYVDNEMLVSKNVYSTGEVVIGEWLGKTLYRKVIEITNPTLDAWTNVNHNISNMDFGRIVDATITRTIYGTTSYIPIGVSNISAGTLFTCDLQKTIFEYKIAGYTNITKLTAVVEYTKTTD